VTQQVVELILNHPDYMSGRMDRVLLRFPNITRAIIAVLRHADTHKVFSEMAEPSDGGTPVRDLPVDEKFEALSSMDGVEVILHELLLCL
jgi:predicted metallopeptidase